MGWAKYMEDDIEITNDRMYLYRKPERKTEVPVTSTIKNNKNEISGRELINELYEKSNKRSLKSAHKATKVA